MFVYVYLLLSVFFFFLLFEQYKIAENVELNNKTMASFC